MKQKSKKKKLKPFHGIIQQCPDCGAIDVYKDDNHYCDRKYQEDRDYRDELSRND